MTQRKGVFPVVNYSSGSVHDNGCRHQFWLARCSLWRDKVTEIALGQGRLGSVPRKCSIGGRFEAPSLLRFLVGLMNLLSTRTTGGGSICLMCNQSKRWP